VLLTGAATALGLVLGPALAVVAARLSPAPTGVRDSAPAPQRVEAGNLPRAAVPAEPAEGSAEGPATAHSPGVALPAAAGTSMLTGLLFAATAQRFGANPALPAFLYLAAVGVTVAVVDLRSHRLPNALTLPSYPAAAALLGMAAVAGSGSGSLGRALLGGAASYLLLLTLRLATPRGVGFGDVKLAGILGMYGGWLGWSAWTLSLLTASLYAGAVGVVLLASGRAWLRSRGAVGPYLVAGALTAALVGPQLIDSAVTL